MPVRTPHNKTVRIAVLLIPIQHLQNLRYIFIKQVLVSEALKMLKHHHYIIQRKTRYKLISHGRGARLHKSFRINGHCKIPYRTPLQSVVCRNPICIYALQIRIHGILQLFVIRAVRERILHTPFKSSYAYLPQLIIFLAAEIVIIFYIKRIPGFVCICRRNLNFSLRFCFYISEAPEPIRLKNDFFPF